MISKINWDRNTSGIVAILIIFILFLAFSSPFENVPRIDDPPYAWMVNHFLETGRFVPHENISAAAFTTTLAGAFFAGLLGFSYTTLHISTLVFSFAGMLAFWYLARYWTGRGSYALCAVLILGTNPKYLYYSDSFMNHVPFTALVIISLFLYLTGIEKNREARLWMASIVASAALLTRQIGLFPVIAAWLYAAFRGDLFCEGKKTFFKKSMAIGLLPAMAFLGYEFWFFEIHGTTWAYRAHVTFGISDRLDHPFMILRDLRNYFAYLGFVTIPFLPGFILKARKRIDSKAFWIISILSLGAATGAFLSFLPGSGSSGSTAVLLFQAGFSMARSLFMGMLLWVVLLETWSMVRERGRSSSRNELVLILFILTLGISVMKKSYLSYLIPIFPLAILLVIPRDKDTGPSKWVRAGVSTMVVFNLLIGISSSKSDFLRTRHRWDIAHQLVDSGVSPNYIDAGLEWNEHYSFDFWSAEARKRAGPQQLSTSLWQKLLRENAKFLVTMDCNPDDPRVTQSHNYSSTFGIGPDKTVCAVDLQHTIEKQE